MQKKKIFTKMFLIKNSYYKWVWPPDSFWYSHSSGEDYRHIRGTTPVASIGRDTA